MIHFKELAYTIIGVGKSEICRRTDQHAGNSLAGSDAAVLRQNFFFLRETLVLLTRRPD